MSSVFVVWYDNGEPWEDAYKGLIRVFATRAGAEAHIRESGYTQEEGGHYRYGYEKPTETCPNGMTADAVDRSWKLACCECTLDRCWFGKWRRRHYDYSYMYIVEEELYD